MAITEKEYEYFTNVVSAILQGDQINLIETKAQSGDRALVVCAILTSDDEGEVCAPLMELFMPQEALARFTHPDGAAGIYADVSVEVEEAN